MTTAFGRGQPRCGPAAPVQVGQPATQHRIGEHGGAPVVDRDGGVPPPGDPHGSKLSMPEPPAHVDAARGATLERRMGLFARLLAARTVVALGTALGRWR